MIVSLIGFAALLLLAEGALGGERGLALRAVPAKDGKALRGGESRLVGGRLQMTCGSTR